MKKFEKIATKDREPLGPPFIDCARQLAHEIDERGFTVEEKRGVQSGHFCQVGPLQVLASFCTAIWINLNRPDLNTMKKFQRKAV